MRVLMLSWEFPPYIVGGLGVVVHDISKYLLKDGVDVLIALPFASSFDSFFKGKLISLFNNAPSYSSYISFDLLQRVKHQPKGDIISFSKEYAKRCIEVCKDLDFDIIHAHDWISAIAGIELKKLTSKPLIIHVHSTEFDRAGGGRGNEVVHEIEREAFMYADKIIAVSNLVKRWIVEGYNIPPEKVKVVYNAVDYSSFPAPCICDKKHRLVMYVGRLSWMKGVEYFLRAAEIVSRYINNVRFLVVGKGEMLPQLIREACKLGIADKVFFEGYVKREEILSKYYANADVLVIPSRSEPFGLIALEAAYYSLPIVLSKQSGVSEVLNSALKVDYWDTEEMANKIICLLKHEPLNKEIRKNIRKELKDINWENYVKEIKTIYREVLR